MFVLDGDYEPPCMRTDPELFFSTKRDGIRQAKKLCGTCRVQLICLEKALDFERLSNETLHGIHGGLTPEERKQIALHRIA